MSGTVDRTRQLVEASRSGHLGLKASLQAAGVELPQHNSKTTKTTKKAAAKKSAAKKTAAKKTAVKSPAKKAAKKS